MSQYDCVAQFDKIEDSIRVLTLETSLEYRHFIRSQKAGIVMFSAAWCGDCYDIEPYLPELEQSFTNRVRFAKIDVDHLHEMARFHQVVGVPSFILFRSGQEVYRLVNPRRKTLSEIKEFVEKGLSLKPIQEDL